VEIFAADSTGMQTALLFRGAVHDNGGTEPCWNDVATKIDIRSNFERSVFYIRDNEMLGSRTVGEATLNQLSKHP
jgi:hypothetical protein